MTSTASPTHAIFVTSVRSPLPLMDRVQLEWREIYAWYKCHNFSNISRIFHAFPSHSYMQSHFLFSVSVIWSFIIHLIRHKMIPICQMSTGISYQINHPSPTILSLKICVISVCRLIYLGASIIYYGWISRRKLQLVFVVPKIQIELQTVARSSNYIIVDSGKKLDYDNTRLKSTATRLEDGSCYPQS